MYFEFLHLYALQQRIYNNFLNFSHYDDIILILNRDVEHSLRMHTGVLQYR